MSDLTRTYLKSGSQRRESKKDFSKTISSSSTGAYQKRIPPSLAGNKSERVF